ncbi:ribosome biogenesis GTPase Der [Opitutales bacterium ASA1]|uniref:ribosome biogenesis GTPase Der n=1 Tax=Congregicoccus parvus TaxID=3081749 RepID=UPI002B2E839A|nr:ribosome biogenesis GTPase Der [Opitutales bacterium ASA1]
MSPIVAIVGRPNVGKSRLFNRLTRRRISIVHDHPGVTRDIISADVDGYTLLDTGGFGLAPGDTPSKIIKAVDAQVMFAVEMAHLILFVVDAQQGVAPMDEDIAKRLRKSGKRVVLVVNKVDHPRHDAAVSDAFRLGLGQPVAVSAEHGLGEEDVRLRVTRALDLPDDAPEAEPVAEADRRLRICFIGRPNVGKSSIANRVIGSDRLIVSDVPGTTREAVDLDFDYKSKKGEVWKFSLTDTAGLKKSTKLASPVEYFSQLRSVDAIGRADVVYLVLDAVDGVGAQDKAIAGEAVKAHKPLIVVVNKWDLGRKAFAEGRVAKYETEDHFRKAFAEAVESMIFFSPGSPVLFTSAITGFQIEAMLRAARKLDGRLDQQLPTGELNRVITRVTEKMPPPKVDGIRFRIYYAVQTGTRPYRIKLFCNQTRRLGESYRRYLERGVVEEFDLQGCPVHFDLVGKEPRD